jgi:hypothetical protein
MRRGWVVAGLAAAALVAPATAFAHGRGPVVAVSDQARITRIRPVDPPFSARVIDGDQGLWLRLASRRELIVLGVAGEPLLRFDGAGVYVNRYSPTAQIDQIARTAITPRFDPKTPPSWKKLSSGQSYRWHDHRLHALAPLGGSGPARALGTWTIPLRLDGKPAALTGELWYVPPPRLLLWLAIPIFVFAGSLATIRARRQRLVEHTIVILTATTAIALVVARAGRELYGRPQPAVVGYVSFGVGVALALFVLDRLLFRPSPTRWFVALVVGALGFAEGLSLLPTLYHGLVLAAVPASLERTCVALALGCGVATVVLSVFNGLDGVEDTETPKTAPGVLAPPS